MLSMAKYADLDSLHEDPVVVLPCGHFFCVSTLDGVMGLDRDGFAVKLEYSYVTPRACPNCKVAIRGVNRYGKVQKVAELRLMERKHQKDTLTQFHELVAVTAEKKKARNKPRSWFKDLIKGKLREAKREAAELNKMLEALEELLRDVRRGPMTQVNETLPVSMRLRNAEQRIDMYQTGALLEMGRACVPHIYAVSNDDVMYRVARGALQSAIELTNLSGSHRSGAEARLLLVEAFLADHRTVTSSWRFEKFLWEREVEANQLCQWVIQHQSLGIGRSVRDEARFLNLRVEFRERTRVRMAASAWKVFGVTAGYSSNWYQCPNGHEYTIGNCGGPSHYARCPECGALIGGQDHVLTADNRRGHLIG